MDIKEILVPVDLSDSARAACMHAAGLAERFRATITLLHVDEISTYGFHGSEALAEYVGRVEVARTQWLQRQEAALSGWGIAHRVLTTVGTAAREILKHAEENPVDMIVMGRHGEAGARRFFMGSTTKRVVRRSQVPVLVVPWRESDQIPESPVIYEHILAPTDFSPDSDHGLTTALELAEALSARVTLFHVADVPPVASVPGEPPYWLPNETVESLRAESEARLARVADERGDPRLSFHAMVSTSVAGSIVEAGEALHADVIAVPTHGKGLLHAFFVGSNTTRVLRLSAIPLLVLPRAFFARKHGIPIEE